MKQTFFPRILQKMIAAMVCTRAFAGNVPPAILPAAQFIPATQQDLSPVGIQVALRSFRPQALALSPDGAILATSGKTNQLVIVDPVTGAILQRVSLPSASASEEKPAIVSANILEPDKGAQLSFTGLIFAPDGKRLYLSDVSGTLKVFDIGGDHRVVSSYSIPLPSADAPRRKQEIPAGLAFSSDGKKLYVALNLSNRLLEMDVASKKVLRLFDVGVAPFDVVLVGNKAYVSNWGGRRPDTNSLTGPAGQGMRVRVDSIRHIANEGSVTVIDLKTGKVTVEIRADLHSSALALSPNHRRLYVANASADSITVIDTRSDKVVDTISLRWHPNDIFGASPNALAMSADGKTLYVCNGAQNAVAVVSLKSSTAKLLGLIPVGWYPGAIIEDARRKSLYVANIKGLLPAQPEMKYNTHEYFGTLSLLPIPNADELAHQTKVVLHNYRREVAGLSTLPARPNTPARAVPERVGEPSLIKHIVYLIKENRTYDQVLGDVKEGNGSEKLCVFGERVTPNQHKLVRDFTLLDNIYCSGILSADGHQWATSAFATDYMERSFAGFPRSYPDGMEPNDVDALVYSPAGFIWDNALAHGRTFRDYGEYTIGTATWKNPHGHKAPEAADFYRDFVEGTDLMSYSCVPGVASLAPYIKTNIVGWNLSVPDVYRASEIIKELHEFEAKGTLPELIIICLPSDHTSGTKAGKPTPEACLADNDLAFGQLVEAFSHSRFWNDMCIFAIEDDPQAGWDHVSGYRTTAYLAGPYVRRHTVVSTSYNQPGLLRTMELMLGLPPMNQMDASATPLFDCFTNTPDFTPYTALTNNVPLNQMNPAVTKIKDPIQRWYAEASAKLPLENPDQCPETLLNRILWNIERGGDAPYPQWAITTRDDD